MARGNWQLVALTQRLDFSPPAGTVVAVLPLKTHRGPDLGRAIEATLQTRQIGLALVKAAALQRPSAMAGMLVLKQSARPSCKALDHG